MILALLEGLAIPSILLFMLNIVLGIAGLVNVFKTFKALKIFHLELTGKNRDTRLKYLDQVRGVKAGLTVAVILTLPSLVLSLLFLLF